MHRDSTWLTARRLRWALAGVLAGALALGCAGGASNGGAEAVATDGGNTSDAAAASDGSTATASDDVAAATVDDTTVVVGDVVGVDDVGVVANDAAPDAVKADAAEPDAPLCSSLATSGEPKALEPLLAAAHVLDHTGAPVDVDVVKGKWTVIWFYPAAQTAG